MPQGSTPLYRPYVRHKIGLLMNTKHEQDKRLSGNNVLKTGFTAGYGHVLIDDQFADANALSNTSLLTTRLCPYTLILL
jgi:hypothetical protein